MGCASSKDKNTDGKPEAAAKTRKSVGAGDEVRRNSLMNSKIQQALQRKQLEHLHDKHPMSFERILLKFEKMRAVIKEVKDVYEELSGGKGLNLEGLQNAITRLHGSLTVSEIKDLFGFIDLDESKSIELNEFLVALTIGMCLETFPTLQPGSDNGSNLRKQSMSTFHGKQSEVYEMLNLIVSAYLLFDSKAEGFIRKEAVDEMLDEAGKKQKHNAMLNQDRWAEMDWDESGAIDFAEFIIAFTKWIDINEED